MIATHTGLFRAARGDRTARRVGRDRQDTMGFTVVGPDHFLGSGHPASADLPPFLGLIRSRDGGRSWKPVSLLGQVDFHALEVRGRRVYGSGTDWKTRAPRLLASEDGGRTWTRLRAPEEVVDLAVDPHDGRHVLLAGTRRLHESRNGGRSWRVLNAPTGLLGWNEEVFVARRGGTLLAASRPNGPWRRRGDVGGEPAAVTAEIGRVLYAALHDGLVEESRDGGRTWRIRSSPTE